MNNQEAIAYGNDYYIDLISSCCEVDKKHKEFVRMSIKALKQDPLTEEDYIELHDRFGDYVEFVVRDMVSGKGERWTKNGDNNPQYCDRNICISNEYNGISCSECEVTKSQEPSGDAISRQAVMNCIDGYSRMILRPLDLKEYIDKLPPINPQPKIGHWIMPVNDDGMSDPIYYQIRCSKCGFDLDPQTWHMELHQYGADKYCPKCGCHMFEPHESEDKEC